METKLAKDETILDPDLKLRPARWDDVETVAKLIYVVCAADGDTTVAVTPQELTHEWQNPGFVVERDAILVETADGRVVGYEECSNGHKHAVLHTDGYVHPDFKGRGIGTTLLRSVEKRALEEMALAEPDVSVSITIRSCAPAAKLIKNKNVSHGDTESLRFFIAFLRVSVAWWQNGFA